MKTTIEINENSSIQEMQQVIEGLRPDFSLDTENGTIHFHAVDGGFIEDPEHGELCFTSLSREELEDYYSHK